MTFIKQLLRSPVRAAAFMLLLALSGAMLCIGFNAYIDVNKQVAELNENYTTIAVPDYRISEIIDSPDIYDPIELMQVEIKHRQRLRSACETALNSNYVMRTDQRDIFSAYIPGSSAMISGSGDWRDYEAIFDQPYNLAVFVITCNDIEVHEGNSYTVFSKDGEIEETYSAKSYSITADVNECVLIHEDYPLPERLVLDGDIMDEDGNIPFEKGKRYLVWGEYTGQPIEQTGPDEWNINKGVLPRLQVGHHTLYSNAPVEVEHNQNGDIYRIKKMIDGYPICAEVPQGMTASGFINSNDGIWRESIIKLCDITMQSVPVITTNLLESLLMFNKNEAYIDEGRSFCPEEYSSGDRVCLVNSEYARRNGLKVGERLLLSFYNPGYGTTSRPTIKGNSDIGIISMSPYTSDAEMGGQVEYTIIGTYNSPGFIYSSHAISPNTIFIPSASASIPKPPVELDQGAKDMEPLWDLDVLYSIVLKNGTAEAFEAELEAQGYGGCFLYYDQGYAEASEGIDAMVLNAGRLMLFSTVLFLTAGVLFAYLYMRWARRSAGIMRLIGARPGQVFTGMSVCALLAAGVSLALGCVISYFLYDGICEAVFGAGGGEMAFSVPWALIGAAAGLAFIMAACMCFFAVVIRRGAMRLNGEHKG